ncbi:MAG: RNA polymerase sigma-70 factor [Bacteroidales bacterium]|nr:RNA polymerase sigma-70 factor [Bacteroidales bacterium]
MNINIELCWQKIKNNEVPALEKVYKASFHPLVHYASEITRQPQLAEEIVQDVLLKIWENRSELSINGSFKSYLFQSVHNQALNALRQQKTKKETVNLLSSEGTLQFISDNYDINDDLIEKIYSDETEAIIEHAVDKLPEQCRKVFRMSRFDSLQNGEIASQLGLSENTVKTHIYRALKNITSALKKEI